MPAKLSKAGTARKQPPRILAVRASAGAGKTYQLTIRFLELLKRVHPSPQDLRQIVAITFTNRAAAEMKDRVILALKHLALGTKEGKRLAAETGLAPAEARAWLDIILEHFGDFQVRTIDSLIYTVMRAFAVEMGLPPELDVDFDRDAMLDRCFDRLLASVAWDNPSDRYRRIIVDLIETYLNIQQAVGMALERPIRKRIRELYALAAEAAREAKEPDRDAAYAELAAKSRNFLAALDKAGLTERLRRSESIREYLEAPADNLDTTFWAKESLRDLKKKAQEFDEGKLDELDALFADLKAARDAYLDCHARATIYPYLVALEELRKEVRIQSECEGRVLGGNWLDRAHDYLREGEGRGSYALLKIGSAIHHFLIDEFQDTSRRQWETLFVLVEECLANGGTLFYVGDVKQAIYGWRGGDWRLFDEVFGQKIRSVELDEHAERVLETNYRSLPAIVEFNNKLYGTLTDGAFTQALARRMMPKETPDAKCDELAATIAANFKDVQQHTKPGLARSAGTGRVMVRHFAGSTEELYHDIEAALRAEVKEAWAHRKQGIAVLVRSNEQAEMVATWLVAEGIPIVTENSLRLKTSPLVKGLVAYLHFLEYPLDDMAFWGALASPLFAGLAGGPQAEAFASFLRAGGWPKPLYRAFEKTFPELAKPLVRDLVSLGGYLAPYDLVREVLAAFRVAERFPDDSVFTQRFLEIVFQAEASGSMSLSGFLQFWDEGGMDEQIGLPEDLSAVRILTIHKAKGLEFPVVFVPFTNWRRRGDSEGLTAEGELVWLRASKNLPLSRALTELKLTTTMKDAIENLNTLYVATTRPREELHLYVTCPSRGGKPNSDYLAAWLADMLAAAGVEAK
ncbi:MAG TPA: UvrD-helicase domain-containing protein [bacterium]|nr:UvrD-helicase domain-containing protein [bacterium]